MGGRSVFFVRGFAYFLELFFAEKHRREQALPERIERTVGDDVIGAVFYVAQNDDFMLVIYGTGEGDVREGPACRDASGNLCDFVYGGYASADFDDAEYKVFLMILSLFMML